MMEELKTGIYKITCLESNNIYIGQANNIEDRWKAHIRCLNRGVHYNTHLQRAWNKYGENNFIFEIVEICEQQKLNDREIYWIEELDSFKNGYNRTAGGGGTLGRKYTQEEIEKRSGENNPFYKKKHKDGWLKMVVSLSNLSTSKPIFQIDSKTGEIINKYSSMSEASRMFGISTTAIQLCSTGLNKRAKGYYWILEEGYSSFEFKPYNNKSIIKVCQINFETGKLIEIFDSISDASRKVGTISSSITDCCKGRQKSCAGYFWKYYEKDDELKEKFTVPTRKATNAILKGSI